MQVTLDAIVGTLAEIKAVLTNSWKPYYTVDEVASFTGRSPYTVRRWVAERRITAQRVEGTGPKGRLLIPREQLHKLIADAKGDHILGAMLGSE